MTRPVCDDQAQDLVAIVITNRGKPVQVVGSTVAGVSRPYASSFCREYNRLRHGALRQQGLRAMAVPVW